jgi:hypothetical protein
MNFVMATTTDPNPGYADAGGPLAHSPVRRIL